MEDQGFKEWSNLVSQSVILTIAIIALSLFSTLIQARPYPMLTGLAAAADGPASAQSNPAGLSRLNARGFEAVLYGFSSDSTWEGTLGDTGIVTNSQSDSNTWFPNGSYVQPINDDWTFGLTFLGAAMGEDYADDWAGRYIVTDYDLLSVSALPSMAYRINDKLSIAASIAATYSTYEQISVAYGGDPDSQDGIMKVDTDGATFGFGFSALYEISEHTRVGVSYRSETDASLDGKAKFSTSNWQSLVNR